MTTRNRMIISNLDYSGILLLIIFVSITILVTVNVVPVFAANNPYLECPDCNGTNNNQQMPPIPTPPPISQPLPPTHINPYVRCTNCTDTGNNQSLSQLTQSTSTPITTPAKIPNWVKGVFNFYAEGKLSDDDLIKALQFLIQQGIIKV